MKKKLIILFLSIISTVCLAFGLSACGEKEVYSTLEMEEGIIYLTDFSVQYTSEAESPNGNIDESSLAEEKSGSVQNYFMVMSFDMQTASDIINTEYLTVTLTVLDADVVNTTIDYTNTSATEEKTSDGQTIITATYSLPDKAKLVKSIQLVVELKPNNIGATDIAYEFSSDSKSVTGYNNEECTFELSENNVSVCNSYLKYSWSNGSYTVTGFKNKSGTTYIRDTYNGLPVTAIGSKAFYNCTSLTSITIPDSVTSIGDSAFYGCTALTSITIPDGVTSIGSYAFENCTALTYNEYGNGYYLGNSNNKYNILVEVINKSTTSFNIYKNTKIIYYRTFKDCISLTSITIPDSVIYIGSWTFNGCTSLESITISDSVTSIADSAFYNCTSLTNITIPDNVTSIGNSAFSHCTSLTSITIPDGVTSIGKSAFEYCTSLTSITVDNENKYYKSIDGNLYSYDGTKLIQYAIGKSSYFITIPSNVTSIDNSAFRYCSKLTSVTIGNSVTSIGDYAFCGCTALTDITIGNGVEIIGSSAFYDCTALTSITIPDSVTSIGEKEFYNCTSLENAIIGSGVNSLRDGLFYGCSSLVSITLPFVGSSANADTASEETLFGYIFGTNSYTGGTSTRQYYSGSSYKTYYIPASLTTVTITGGNILYGTFFNCTSLENITIPLLDDVSYIGSHAFIYCSSLTSITINDVKSIGDYAFAYCDSLTSITIPDSVTSIGDSAFYKCTSLTSITIPYGVTSIGDVTFSGCTSLTSITIPDGVTSIGSSAFSGCTKLTSVTIGSGVTYIGKGAFEYCSKLTSATFKNASGWYITTTKGASSGTDISSSDLSNTSTAAKYLTSTYYAYYWYKK